MNAVKILKEKGAKFKVLIAGDGELLDEMIEMSNRNELSEVVTFLGWVSDKDSFYKQIDIFCLPSLKEPFGIVLLEAMSKSKLIVATNIDGPKEIIINGHSGILCEKNNCEDLAEGLFHAIKIVSNQKDYYEKITKNAYERLIFNYSINSVGERLVSFLDEIILR